MHFKSKNIPLHFPTHPRTMDVYSYVASALVTALMLALSRYANEVTHWVTHELLGAFFSRPKLAVREFDARGFANAHFVNLSWYVSARCASFRGDCSAFQHTNDGDTFVIPCDGRFCRLTDDVQFRVASEARHNKDDMRMFELRGKSVEVCTLLLHEVAAAHAEHVRTQRWAQEIYAHECGDWDVVFRGPQCGDAAAPALDERVVLDRPLRDALVADLAAFMGGRDEYARLGLSWKRGYLLCGPPGTGKTTLIRALSECYRMPIYLMTLNAVKSDADLASLFLKLPTAAPCVVVMEEIDVVCPAATRARRVSPAPPRGAAADDADAPPDATSMLNMGITLSGLLNTLDGVMGCHGRVVVATTNHPEALDPALLRPGRFDMRVTLGHCTPAQAHALFVRFFGKPASPSLGLIKTALEGAGGSVSPAHVSGVLLAHRTDAAAALLALSKKMA